MAVLADHVGHSAFFFENRQKLLDSLLRRSSRDSLSIMLRKAAAYRSQDLFRQLLAADVVDRLPNRRHHQLLVVGKQEHQRGLGRRVKVARPPSARKLLGRLLNETRSHHLVELLRHGRPGHTRLIDQFGHRARRVPHQKFYHPHSSGRNCCTSHVRSYQKELSQ